ncbi:MAG: hypothetical protein JHC93_00625 [Parachlamydiales bacterium]|nr:hypothetical protein [Parachlamydiales bacterium]
MRILISLLVMCATAAGGWYLWNQNSDVRNFIQSHLDSGNFSTLEVRYTADQIMALHKPELLKTSNYSYLEPTLKFYPYALLDVKYSNHHDATHEGVILWGLEDGEMVLETANWTKTHGIEDCINSRADKTDYRFIFALSKTGGRADRSRLLDALHVESEVLDSMAESCRKKKLIVQQGNEYRLHFHRPLIQHVPETKLDHWLVTMPYKNAERIGSQYSLSQIKETAYNLFGNDFTVRNIVEIYLPVYSITVQNPDGSRFTTHWNALNGKRFTNSSVK